MNYDFKNIEKNWQEYWDKNKIYKTENKSDKKKYYILDMFPYPSGDGLHVGHTKGYIATDILTRYKKRQNFNVLHPIGFDAFGLPAENFAIKNKIHPKLAIDQNIKNYKKQMQEVGLSYDWDREINTTDPDYYKWTQWAFLKMYEKGLVYQSFEPINWCPKCKTGLANEDLENGKCERCDSDVEQKPMRQWVIKITDYAERLLNDLNLLTEWPDFVKEMQKNWIGKSVGVNIDFKLVNNDKKITIFTTRIDTIFGCTYLVLAPENKLIEELFDFNKIENIEEVQNYIEKSKNKTHLQRTDLNKDKTGIKIKGVQAINPFNNETIDIYIADYVLNSYGTGAVMAVPAHDTRDYEFAKKYNLNIKQVIKSNEDCFIDDGILINSAEFTNLNSKDAREKMLQKAIKEKFGVEKTTYKLRDWVFSRQRYWGEPIPLIHCSKCGVVPEKEENLPIVLPHIKNYEPTGTGESPLANIENWVNVKCPKCGEDAKRETNTMPQWAGSCWYYLRYIDNKNDKELLNSDLEKYWEEVDFYVGGLEHATRHLIYARFWHKFLKDINVVSTVEPFLHLEPVGIVLAEDGRKMSKRWGNVINPSKVIEDYGADVLRVYEMFMSPFADSCSWNTKSLLGIKRFLEKVYKLINKIEKNLNIDEKQFCNLNVLLNKTIKKVTLDIENFKFNTAISQMMILVNEINNYDKIPYIVLEKLILILAPFAPYLTEEIWHKLGNNNSIHLENWPKYDEKLTIDESFTIGVQINGKLRGEININKDDDENIVLNKAKENPDIYKWLKDKHILKTIYIKNKILNLIIK